MKTNRIILLLCLTTASVLIANEQELVHAKTSRIISLEEAKLKEGEGTWTLDGVESPAKKGDVLYVEPWVFHGLTNTGEKDMVFFVIKYHPKDTPLPPEPKGSHGR